MLFLFDVKNELGIDIFFCANMYLFCKENANYIFVSGKYVFDKNISVRENRSS